MTRRLILTLLLAATVSLSCDGGTTALSADLFAGSWVLNSAANPTCSGAAGAASRYFDVETSSLDDGTFNVVEPWDVVVPNRGFGWLVTGSFNLRARTVVLNFWQTTLSVGSEFSGTINSDGSITGTLRDPKPGYSPHFVVGTCQFTATGHRLP